MRDRTFLRTGRRFMKRWLISIVGGAGACIAALTMPAQADVISDWNATAEAIQLEQEIGGPPSARTLAILHVAMFEAVNAVDHRYTPYRLNLTAEPGASAEAAAAVENPYLSAINPGPRFP